MTGIFQNALYVCHRGKCGFKGAVFTKKLNYRLKIQAPDQNELNQTYQLPDVELLPLNEDCLKFFEIRGISKATLKRNRIGMQMRGKQPHIAFPYFRDGKLVNVKYRSLDKKFSQVRQSAFHLSISCAAA